MNTRRNMSIGLGAAALLLATPFIVSACQSTKVMREQNAMMGATFGEHANKECPCAKQGNKCECKDGNCGGFSCGGEGSGAMCDAKTVEE